jgi:hypothetical protein
LIGALAAETLLFTALYMWPGFILILLLVHFGISGIILLLAYRRFNNNEEFSMMFTLGIGLVFMGIIAPAVLLCLQPILARFKRDSTPFEEWYNSLFPDQTESAPEKLFNSVRRHETPGRETSGVVSFSDIITSGSTTQKFATIAMIARSFKPSFTPVLKQALQDDANEIRVQAATAIGKVTDDYIKKIQILEDKLTRNPDDPKSLMALANLYDDFSYTGILDQSHEHKTRSRALDLWLKVCSLERENDAGQLAVGRLLMRLEKLDLAVTWLERIIHEGKATPKIIAWYMECLFQTGKLDELRKFAASPLSVIPEKNELSPSSLAAIGLWRATHSSGAPSHV